jgi:hypothetical protein
LVGAEGVDGVGAVYLFTFANGEWSQSGAALSSSDGTDGDSFGSAVALSDDTLTAVVSAPAKDTARGAVYVFTRASVGAAFSQVAKLTASDAGDFDAFGAALALRGRTLLVGATFKRETSARTGVVYEFEGSGAQWVEKEAVLVPEGAFHY